MSQQQYATPPHRLTPWRIWVPACTVLALLQVWLAGYELGVGNQSIQVPFLLRLHDPALFARDAMVTGTLDQYPSLFFRLLAPLLGFIALPTLYFALHLVTATAVLLGVVALCRAMFRSDGAALVAVGLLLAGHQQALAEQTLYSTGFTHTWAVFPLTIAALVLLYNDRPIAAFALAGLSFNFHALEAGQLMLVMAFWAVWSIPPRKVIRLLVVFAGLALPTLIHLLVHRQVFGAQWMQMMHVRSGHHGFPFTWWRAGQPDVPQFLMILALGGVALSLAPPRQLRTTLLLVAGIAILFVAGILFTEVWPNALLVRAQLFRSSRFLLVLALACIAGACARGWRHPLEFLLAVVTIACLAVPPWLVFLPVVLIFATLVALINRRLLWSQALLAGIALLVCLAAWRTIAFVLPGKVSLAWHRPEAGNDPRWVDVQRWAREHTPTDALFLTPAQMNGFRVHSQRAIVGEWRDGTQLFFSAAFTQPWWNTMNALQPGMRLAPDGQRLLVQGRSISQLDDAQLIALSQKYGATQIVVASNRVRKLTPLYRNEQWAIYLPELAPVPPVGDEQRFLAEVALPNIEKYRKGVARLQIVDDGGRPLYDAQYRIAPTGNLPVFNCRVVTTPAWWLNIEPQSDQRRYAALEKALTPGPPIEFSFLAGFPPRWFDAAQTNRLTQHALDLVTRYANRVEYWELTDQGLFMGAMSNLVTQLRHKFPGIKLGISDAPRLDHFDETRGLADVRRLPPLDFVALRCRQPLGVWASAQSLYDLFDAFAEEGVRIHITQFDPPRAGWIEGPVRRGQQWTPALQAEYTRFFYTVAFSHPAVELIAGTPLPEWHSETNSTVPIDGRINFHGYHGNYEITVGPKLTAPFVIGPGTNDYRFEVNAAGNALTRIK